VKNCKILNQTEGAISGKLSDSFELKPFIGKEKELDGSTWDDSFPHMA
jgi:hypothetical protein